MNNYPPLYITPQPFIPDSQRVTKVRPQTQTVKQAPLTQEGLSFNDMFTESVTQQEKLKFSAHAQERAQMRNIKLNENQLARLGSGVDKASSRGSKEALVLVDNVAAVVNVANKTIITVTDTSSVRDNVYTNIDSAVIA